MPEADDDAREFTPAERKQIRQMVEAQERAQWFWSTVRVWVTWIAATIAAIYATFEILSKHIRLKIGGG